MNHRPPGLDIVKAVQGFLQFKSAEGLSARTIESYSRDLQQWMENQGTMDVVKVTPQQLRQYLTYLLTEYVPRPLTGNNDVKLSPKTVRNVWVTLSAFFHWIGDEFQIPNPMKMVPAPKFEDPPVEPFRREEIEAILKVCNYCQEAKTNARHKFTMRRVTGFRDKAIVLVLLDSGLRASELCSLRIGDFDARREKFKSGMEWGAERKATKVGQFTSGKRRVKPSGAILWSAKMAKTRMSLFSWGVILVLLIGMHYVR
jgi:integrase/recombinase XerD